MRQGFPEKKDPVFRVVTGYDFARAIARFEPNLVMAQIAMLRARNFMIHYTKNEPVGKPAYYACMAANNVMIGTIEMEADGFYYFFPHVTGGAWDSQTLYDLASKMDELNAAWVETLKNSGVEIKSQ